MKYLIIFLLALVSVSCSANPKSMSVSYMGFQEGNVIRYQNQHDIECLKSSPFQCNFLESNALVLLLELDYEMEVIENETRNLIIKYELCSDNNCLERSHRVESFQLLVDEVPNCSICIVEVLPYDVFSGITDVNNLKIGLTLTYQKLYSSKKPIHLVDRQIIDFIQAKNLVFVFGYDLEKSAPKTAYIDFAGVVEIR